MKRRYGLLSATVLVAGALGWWWFRGPDVPEVDPTGLDPAVARAVEQARTEVRNRPRSAASWGKLAMVFHANVLPTEAILAYDHAAEREPRQPKWPYLRGLLRLSQAPEVAEEDLRHAATLAPGDVAIRLRLAETLLAVGKNDEAASLLGELAEREPDHPRVAYLQARLCLATGDEADCLRLLGPAFAHPVTRKAARTLRVEVLRRRADPSAEREAAGAEEEPEAPEWPDPYTAEVARFRVGEAALLNRAERLAATGQRAEALREIEEVLRAYPNSAAALIQRGLYQFEDNALDQAESDLRRALERDRESSRGWRYLGLTLQKRGRRDEAVAAFREGVRLRPHDAAARYNLGFCLQEAGDLPGAETELRAALAVRPTLTAAHMRLGEVLRQRGRADEARRHLEQALVLDPTEKRARELLEK